MLAAPPGTISQLLADVRNGDRQAGEDLGQLLVEQLHGLAERALKRERVGHTLQAGDLVQEVLLRLLEDNVLGAAPNRGYLFGAASNAMRRVLVEYARRRGRLKRGGGQQRIALLDDVLDHYASTRIDLIALHEALEELGRLNPRQSRIVDEYHFGGFTLREIAEHLGVSEATICIDLRRAQLWLSARLGEGTR